LLHQTPWILLPCVDELLDLVVKYYPRLAFNLNGKKASSYIYNLKYDDDNITILGQGRETNFRKS
jgi:hypothetical protein